MKFAAVLSKGVEGDNGGGTVQLPLSCKKGNQKVGISKR